MTTQCDATQAAVSRIGTILQERGLDVVLLLGLENVQFAAGAPLRSASALDRPNVILVDRDGKGVVFTSQETVSTVGLMAPSLEVLGYDERGARFPNGIVDRVADYLSSMYASTARLGFEADRMPVVAHAMLHRLLPAADLVEFDDALRLLRMVKSPPEIATIAEAAALTEQALARTIADLSAGMTEREVADRLVSHMQSAGFSTVDPLVGGGPNAARIGPPTARRFEDGDWVRLDVKSRYQGYFYTDAGRMAVVGKPDQAQQDAYARQYELNRRVIEYMGPGRRCGDVYLHARRECENLGIELFNYGHIGIGHGIGVGGTERPVLHERDDVILEPGMIVNIEPNTYGPDREILHIEDMLLITDEGADPISHREDWTTLRSTGGLP
ncbi:M24 family metallopeptidase [Rhodococcus sp. JS3073]|uniref:M24 family metallopeptidase n=1 Tax=Rhodococcus sp. JS3073 TaxID=3002901 RepID=UPI00228678AD|nr:M24 family metallopeptidase [Rhodococcus sp. JS3073]WAM18972.1 M24 family metallopeptidase [Rhodococcus sp. JS3073]